MFYVNRIRFFSAFLLVLFVSGCSTFYELKRDYSTFFTEVQQELFEKTSEAAGFGSGFDDSLYLDYVFVTDPGKESSSKETVQDLKKIFTKAGQDASLDFMSRILYLKELTVCKMNDYENSESWTEYTAIRNYLLPSMEKYYSSAEAGCSAAWPSLKNALKGKKEIYDKEISEILKKEHGFDMWQTVR